MKKGRFLCIALALCVMMTLTSYAAEAPAYTTCTFQSHNGVVFTFEAARKISRTVSYDDTANGYIEENAEVYLVKPGSSVTVKTTDGADTEYMCMHYVQTDSGHYNALSIEYNRLRSGSVDAWFELSDMAKITTERVTEPVQLEGWNMTWDRVISERTVYVMPDDGSSDTTQPGGTGTAFADVAADAYYADAVAWAVANGITEGKGEGLFAPQDTLTRQEGFTFLYRALDVLGAGFVEGDTALLDSFADGASVAEWARSATATLITNGVVEGSESGLNPAGSLTRAEMAKMLASVV